MTQLQAIHKICTMIIHVQPHWVRLQSTPLLKCSGKKQYHILRSIDALTIINVMSRPGAVRGQSVQHDWWDSAEDFNKWRQKLHGAIC